MNKFVLNIFNVLLSSILTITKMNLFTYSLSHSFTSPKTPLTFLFTPPRNQRFRPSLKGRVNPTTPNKRIKHKKILIRTYSLIHLVTYSLPIHLFTHSLSPKTPLLINLSMIKYHYGKFSRIYTTKKRKSRFIC